MTTSTGRAHCVKCDKEMCTFRCGGCLQEFCFNHLTDHRQELTKQLDEIETNRDLLRQSLSEQMKEPKNHALIQQIEKWEHDSIKKIQETADNAKHLLIKHTTGHIDQTEIKLNKLTDQLREIRQENDFNEINLLQFQDELTRLTTELSKPPNISVRQASSSLINDIYVDVPKHETTSTTSSAVTHTAVGENLAVKSVVNTETQSKVHMENAQKIAALMNKLGTTHQQIDEYSRRRIEQISEEVAVAINRIIVDIQVQQSNLLADANVRSVALEEEYKLKLQFYIKELNAVTAQKLSVIEEDLNLRQEIILEEARKRINDLNEEADHLKFDVLREAQAQQENKENQH